MVTEVYARWLRRPDMVPGVSAATAYAKEWREAASLAQHVDVMPNAVDDIPVGSDEEDEALEWLEEETDAGSGKD